MLVTQPVRRWDSLDALRGTAAFLVLTFHCAQVFPGFAAAVSPLKLAAWSDGWTWMKFTPLRLLVSSGPSAVVLFFALSGFVLSLPFLRGTRVPSFAEFATKRICRIYPPFAAAILVSAGLYALVQPSPILGLSHWVNEVLWDRPLSANYVVRNLAMTGIPRDMTLDLVMWSLVHELRISLIFPLLLLATRRWPSLSLLGSVLLGIACTMALGGTEAASLGMSLVDTGRFVFLFVAGIIIAGQVRHIQSLVARLPNLAAAALWLGSVGLLMLPGPTMSRYYDFVWGAGAIGLIIMVIGSARADRILSAPPLLWLGRVSYSLYLIHVPLLIAMLHVADGILPPYVTVACVIPCSLACAELMHRAVELPSIQLGRVLSGFWPARTRPMLATASAAEQGRLS